MRKNCWEHKKCGREPGGSKVAELGVCPAATETSVNKMNNGKNGGRVCWAVTGTLCGSEVQGSFAAKVASCMKCDFFKIVWREEHQSGDFVNTNEILSVLKKY